MNEQNENESYLGTFWIGDGTGDIVQVISEEGSILEVRKIAKYGQINFYDRTLHASILTSITVFTASFRKMHKPYTSNVKFKNNQIITQEYFWKNQYGDPFINTIKTDTVTGELTSELVSIDGLGFDLGDIPYLTLVEKSQFDRERKSYLRTTWVSKGTGQEYIVTKDEGTSVFINVKSSETRREWKVPIHRLHRDYTQVTDAGN